MLCYGVNSYTENEKLYEVVSERTFELDFERINLLSGKYWLNVSIFSPDNEEYDVIKYSKQFYINQYFMERNLEYIKCVMHGGNSVYESFDFKH